MFLLQNAAAFQQDCPATWVVMEGHRMGWVGRELKAHLVPSPAVGRDVTPGPGCSGPHPGWLWRWIFLLGWCQIYSYGKSSPAEGEELWGSCRRAVQQWCLLFPSASSKWKAPCWAAWDTFCEIVGMTGICVILSLSRGENLPLSTDCAASGKQLLFDSTDPHLQSAGGTRLSPLKLLLRFIYSLWDLIPYKGFMVGAVRERTTTSVNRMWCCGGTSGSWCWSKWRRQYSPTVCCQCQSTFILIFLCQHF